MALTEIEFYDKQGEKNYTQIYGESDICPICDHKIAPKFIIALIEGYHGSRILEVVYKCPNKKCAHLFIAYFQEVRIVKTFLHHSIHV